jgi:selenium-binding protein 1
MKKLAVYQQQFSLERWRAFFVALAVAIIGLASLSLALADETCVSPYMTRIEGQEEFIYVWTLGLKGSGMDQTNL